MHTHWFGVKEFDVHYGQATISVPWTEKKLEVALDPFHKELKPGEAPEAICCPKKDDIIEAREFCTVHGLWKNK